ncbi:hypothetical protein ACFPRL_27210 [Pseudoclavibacter helvolus]
MAAPATSTSLRARQRAQHRLSPAKDPHDTGSAAMGTCAPASTPRPASARSRRREPRSRPRRTLRSRSWTRNQSGQLASLKPRLGLPTAPPARRPAWRPLVLSLRASGSLRPERVARVKLRARCARLPTFWWLSRRAPRGACSFPPCGWRSSPRAS